jgi:hypothetical protein
MRFSSFDQFKQSLTNDVNKDWTHKDKYLTFKGKNKDKDWSYLA